MVYGTKYRVEYCDKYGRQARLDIEIKDYSGDVNMVEGTPDVFKLSYSNENGDKTGYIIHSFADISLYENPITIDDIKTLSETDIRISFYIDNVIFWQGFAIPDFFETGIENNAVISIAASDRISTLKQARFAPSLAREKLIKLVSECLSATGLSLPIVTVVDFSLEAEQSVHSGTDDLLGDMYGSRQRIVNDKGESISAFDVLRSILVLSNSYLVQRANEWWIVNKEQLDGDYGNIRLYRSNGDFVDSKTFQQPMQMFKDINIGGRKTIKPAARDVSIFAELGGAIVGNPDPFLELWDGSKFANIQSENGATQHFSNKVVTGYSGTTALFGTETKKNALRIRDQVYLGENKPRVQPCFKVFVKQIVDAQYKIDLRLELTGRVGMRVGYSILIERNGLYSGLYLNSNGGWTGYFNSNISSGHIKSKSFEGAVGAVVPMEISDSFNLDTFTDLSITGDGEYNIYILLFGTEGQAMDYFVESVQVRLNQLNEPPKGTVLKIEQKADFSKSYDTDTTIFGEYIESGVNGYFYNFPKNDSSIITFANGRVPYLKWSTQNDQTPESLMMKGVRQRSYSLSTARSVLSVSMDIKDIDPLAIFKASCNNDKFNLVECQFDFLKSTADLSLEEITYSSVLKKDFIYSYFGDKDGDNIRSIGTASGSTTVGNPPPSGGGGGSFLDKYFTFDEENDALVANVNLVSEKEIAAYFADGSIPSIFDNFPFATSESTGGIKASSTFQNGIKINASGFLEVDPSYADSGVSSWGDLTDRPTWLTPTTKAAFEAAHGHTWGQITSKPTTFPPAAHNHTPSQVGLGNVGNYSDYARKTQNETITGSWNLRGLTIRNNLSIAPASFVRVQDNGNISVASSYATMLIHGATKTSESLPWKQVNILNLSVGAGALAIKNYGEREHSLEFLTSNGVTTTAGEHELKSVMQVNHLGDINLYGNGTFGGNLTANNGTFTNNIVLGSGLITYDPIKDTIRFNKTVVSDFDIVAFTDSGQSLPSIFDNLPKTSKTSFGVVKVGAGINVSGGVISLDIGSIAPQTLSFNGVDNKLSISGGNTVDLSGLTPDLTGYATENWVQLGFKPIAYQPTWGQITGKPSTFAPSVHNHTIGDVTGLQGALDGYARKGQNETITGAWNFQQPLQAGGYRFGAGHEYWADVSIRMATLRSVHIVSAGSANNGFLRLDSANGINQFRVQENGFVGIGIVPTERLHVVGSGLFTGNLTAKNGTFTNNIVLGSGLITYDHINDTIRFNKTVVSDFDIVAFTDSGQSLPSIFDNLPKTSKTAFGVVKVGAGINVSGGVISLDIGSIAPQTLSFNGVDNKLSISGGNTVDLSGLTPDLTGYATENWVQLGFKPIAYQPTWGQITSKPTTFTPTAHNHIIGDVTGLQGALDGKENTIAAGTTAQYWRGDKSWQILNTTVVPEGTNLYHTNARVKAYADTLYSPLAHTHTPSQVGLGNVGNYSDYARKTQNETITGKWSFNDNVALRGDSNTLALYYNVDGVAKNRVNEIILGRESDFHKWRILNQSTLAYGNDPTLSFQHLGATGSVYADVLTMTNRRNVGIGIATPTEKLHVVGNGLFTGNITAQGEVTAYSSSDIRLKKNIKTIESAIDIIEKLNPVSFNWNEKAIELNSAKDSDRVNYGVVAQEIERVLPDLVHNTNGFKSVDYPQLFGILIRGIQELKLEIEELKSK